MSDKPTDIPAGEQGALFDVPEPHVEQGFRAVQVVQAAGVTYRQLDYWGRTGLVTPSLRQAEGSGSTRLYSFRDLVVVKVIKRLLDTGISLQNVRRAVSQLNEFGVEDLAQIRLLSDGVSVYYATDASEVLNLLDGGQAVFAISLGPVFSDLQGTLTDLITDATRAMPEEEAAPAPSSDELAQRRAQRRGTA